LGKGVFRKRGESLSGGDKSDQGNREKLGGAKITGEETPSAPLKSASQGVSGRAVSR